jgi:hypothetical protein
MSKAIKNPEWQKYYDFLDDLRESGETNMLGAAPYLIANWGMGRGEAREILSGWIKEFSIEEEK